MLLGLNKDKLAAWEALQKVQQDLDASVKAKDEQEAKACSAAVAAAAVVSVLQRWWFPGEAGFCVGRGCLARGRRFVLFRLLWRWVSPGGADILAQRLQLVKEATQLKTEAKEARI